CLPRFQKFDPTKSSRGTFTRRIVNNGAATLIEARTAACRDYRACRKSLSDPLEFAAGESGELGDGVSSDDYEPRVGRSALSARERTELQIDVDKVIATLPNHLATVAIHLKFFSPTESVRQLGLTRSTLYRRIDDIRGAFEVAGLNLYVGRTGRSSK